MDLFGGISFAIQTALPQELLSCPSAFLDEATNNLVTGVLSKSQI
jgi:hypothetical protein